MATTGIDVPAAAPAQQEGRHALQLFAFAEHDGLSLDVPLSRVGVGAEYSHPVFGPVDAFASLEASVGRDMPGGPLSLDTTAKAGFEVHF